MFLISGIFSGLFRITPSHLNRSSQDHQDQGNCEYMLELVAEDLASKTTAVASYSTMKSEICLSLSEITGLHGNCNWPEEDGPVRMFFPLSHNLFSLILVAYRCELSWSHHHLLCKILKGNFFSYVKDRWTDCKFEKGEGWVGMRIATNNLHTSSGLMSHVLGDPQLGDF